jgi:hypothetical protein
LEDKNSIRSFLEKGESGITTIGKPNHDGEEFRVAVGKMKYFENFERFTFIYSKFS